jgi:hypothetical protein
LAASLRHSDKCTSSETAPGHTSGAVNLGTGFLPARGNGGIGPEAGIRRVAELSVPPIAIFSRRRRVQKGNVVALWDQANNSAPAGVSFT